LGGEGDADRSDDQDGGDLEGGGFHGKVPVERKVKEGCLAKSFATVDTLSP